MKSVTAIILMTSTLMANAWGNHLNARSSWEAINASRTLMVMSPLELNPTGGVFNTCVDYDGETLRSIKNVSYCQDGEMVSRNEGDGGNRWEWQCNTHADAPVSITRHSTKRECIRPVNDESGSYCAGYSQVPYTIPTEYYLDVLEANSESFYQVAFRKFYKLPKCLKL